MKMNKTLHILSAVFSLAFSALSFAHNHSTEFKVNGKSVRLTYYKETNTSQGPVLTELKVKLNECLSNQIEVVRVLYNNPRSRISKRPILETTRGYAPDFEIKLIKPMVYNSLIETTKPLIYLDGMTSDVDSSMILNAHLTIDLYENSQCRAFSAAQIEAKAKAVFKNNRPTQRI